MRSSVPRLLSVVCAVMVLLVVPRALVDETPAAAGPVVSARLAGALADPGFPGRDGDGRLATWVFFADRGLDGQALIAALDEAAAELGERARSRNITHRPTRLFKYRFDFLDTNQ